jgi:Uncharacterized protein conserved in bacteria C-term(DUF2220)
MLMDRATLLAHRGQWITEPRPTAAVLDLLDAEEAELYRDLVNGSFGPSVRLEQERIRFAAIEQALENLGGTPVTRNTRRPGWLPGLRRRAVAAAVRYTAGVWLRGHIPYAAIRHIVTGAPRRRGGPA